MNMNMNLLAALMCGVMVVAPCDASAIKGLGQAAAKRAFAAQARPKDVIVHRSRHPEAAAHIEHAQRKGQPTILTVDRAHAAERRKEATGSVGRNYKPKNADRDEYPPAFTSSGGSGASVKWINPRDNRGAGSSIGAQARLVQDGGRIRVLVTD